MQLSRRIACLGTLALIVACQHYPDVHPMANGIHKVSFLTERKTEGYRNAIAQAHDYCKDVYRMSAVQVSESSEYVGTMDEGIYNGAKTASEVVGAIGVAGAVFGGKRESEAGGVGAVGGGVADAALGKGYQYTLEFKCQ